MNGQAGGHISEHAFGNAIDIAGFRLADGRRLTVVHDWTRGDDQSQAFLRDVHAGACNSFTTVLGPGYNAFHYNHIHVDLAMHGGSSRGLRRYCKPAPEQSRPGPRLDTLPEAPQMEEEQDVASNAPPASERSERGPMLGAPSPYAGGGTARRAYAAAPRQPTTRAGGFVPDGTLTDMDATSSIGHR